MASVDSIKVANSKSLEDFTREYLPEFDSTRYVDFSCVFYLNDQLSFFIPDLLGR